MRFADHGWLWGALVVTVALALAFALDFTRRRRLLEKIGHAPQLRRMAHTVSQPRRVLKAVLFCIGMACVALSLARPQVEGSSQWRQRGIDLAIVMDFSKSMYALDVRPSRLARARLEADALIDRLGGDRVSVVAFAGGAVYYPLTTDYDAAKVLYHGMTPEDLLPGSDVAAALVMARCLLRPDLTEDPECERSGGGRGHGGDALDGSEVGAGRRLEVTDLGDRARAIVLFTDGEQTEGDAHAAIAAATQQGIAVYVVGVGTPQGAPIPDLDDDGNQRGWRVDDGGNNVITRLDEAGLKELARLAGGEDHYFRVHPGRLGSEPVAKALARLKEGELETRVIKKYTEAYHWLLFPGFMALMIEACLSDRRRSRKRAQETRA